MHIRPRLLDHHHHHDHDHDSVRWHHRTSDISHIRACHTAVGVEEGCREAWSTPNQQKPKRTSTSTSTSASASTKNAWATRQMAGRVDSGKVRSFRHHHHNNRTVSGTVSGTVKTTGKCRGGATRQSPTWRDLLLLLFSAWALHSYPLGPLVQPAPVPYSPYKIIPYRLRVGTLVYPFDTYVR